MTYVIGIDPGPVVGIAGLLTESEQGADFVQCSVYLAAEIVTLLWARYESEFRVMLAIERFVIRPDTARLNSPKAAKEARNTITLIDAWAATRRIQCVHRSAAEVKPWATDARLHAAGLFDPTVGMRHARDAARHALFAAVKDCGLPDPLSAQRRSV